MLWPIALMRWWFADSTVNILLPVIMGLGVLAGFAVGAVRYHAGGRRDLDALFFPTVIMGFTGGASAMFVLPVSIAVIWFGWPLIAAGAAFWFWLARKYPQKDPAMVEAEREVERIISNGGAP
jgi:hypothetical protein